MGAPLRLILYGNSIFLAGIKAELLETSQLEVITMEPSRQDALGLILALKPCAVVFDLSAAQPDFILAMLRMYPDTLFIGIDPSSDEVLKLSGQRTKIHTGKELVEMVKETMKAPQVEQRERGEI